MSGKRLILAVDIGTSGARGLLFDERAEVIGQTRQPYSTLYPRPGWSEQDAEAVTQGVIEALREMVVRAAEANNRIEAVVLSAQMYSILAVDAHGQPLTHSLTWGDMRAAATADRLRGQASFMLAGRTGCPTQAIYPVSKIRWLVDDGGLPVRVKFVSIKDYVVFRLTGRWLADWSTASASGLLDIRRYDWDDEAVELAGVSRQSLPDLASPREALRGWQPDIREGVGITDNVPLILGAGDAPLANIGVGATSPGTLAINLGTSAAVRALISQPETDPAGRLWTYIADVDRWVIGGIIGAGGVVYEWLLNELLSGTGERSADEIFREADRLARQVPAGADDLLFVPYFAGEQSPGWNATAKGMIYGLTLRHHSGHLIRAAIEGLVFALTRVVRLIEKLRAAPTTAGYITGGLAASDVALHTLADSLSVPVVKPESAESSARGAAILGWLALGAARSDAEFARTEAQIVPDSSLQSLYQARYDAFCELNQRIQTLSGSQE
ncbi:MAG: gluconokinase [Anaerolineae bacterium]|nr:gluconokinase [Anaerolineae bacterium]